jgi:5-methylcytosine-specific restriction protein A
MPRINPSKQRKREQQRNHVEPRYHTQRWRIERKQQLMREPLCRICFETDTITAAQMVDHIKPVRLGGEFWDERNYQSLCNSCHAVKSAKESRLTPGRGISEE